MVKHRRDLVSKIHFPIFDAVVSFFWKNLSHPGVVKPHHHKAKFWLAKVAISSHHARALQGRYGHKIYDSHKRVKAF